GLRPLSQEHLHRLADALGSTSHLLTPSAGRAGHASARRIVVEFLRPLRGRAWFTRRQWHKRVLTFVTVILNVVLLWNVLPLQLDQLNLWFAPPILVIVLTLGFWLRYRDSATKTAQIRVIGGLIFFFSEAYAIQSVSLAWAYPTLTAVIHALAVVWNMGAVSLGVFNQLWPRDTRIPPPLPAVLPEVAAGIPTYGEPLDVL